MTTSAGRYPDGRALCRHRLTLLYQKIESPFPAAWVHMRCGGKGLFFFLLLIGVNELLQRDVNVSVPGFRIGFLYRGKLKSFGRAGLDAGHAVDAVGIIVDGTFVFHLYTSPGADPAAGSKRQEIGPCGSISCDRSHHGS